jgi:hypothetical protein
MVPGGGLEPLPGIRNTYVADSKIDQIAQIAITYIFRHKLGTERAERKPPAQLLSQANDAIQTLLQCRSGFVDLPRPIVRFCRFV